MDRHSMASPTSLTTGRLRRQAFSLRRTRDARPIHCSLWLRLRPFPVRKPSNEIIEGTSLVAICKRFDLELLENLERLEHAGLDCVRQHAGKDLSIRRREAFE